MPKKPKPLPLPSASLLHEAIASLHRKIGAYVIDPIVAGIRRIEATLDRERELRLYGGQR